MANKHSIFLVGYNGALHLVEAENVNAIKRHVLTEVKYSVEKATAREVADMMKDGAKVVTIGAEPVATEPPAA